ncbi:MAG: nicotinate-nucleotide--dimethylbenzimidazole phosphoribosyltransferase [Deltaproteobacteria bacterium]|nr:nicotinate-nucleotide--dimethylbenzimidazole phosphoribosyltransferase [Deltaproteobacteria bacterium]MBW2343847.1 nicotinate-nucleotide--dimethylbenzimidazole phosphoribosyltransferase [Deltaproteobacteria bacterium]
MIMIEQTLKQIKPISKEWLNRARTRLDNLTKPKGSLGMLEEIAARVVAIREEERPSIAKKEVFVFVGDHDVVSEGVSAYPQDVTGLMVRNFLAGGAGINVLARCAGADVSVIDIGMKEDLRDAEGLVRKNVKRAAGNIARGPAMTREEAKKAINVGIEMAEKAYNDGTVIIASGDMGIGNTTPSSAIFSALLPADVIDVTGKGTGLDKEGLRHKVNVIENVLEINRPAMDDPLSTLAAVGGLEIAGICGLFLGGAARRMITVVDGFISGAGALVAMRLNPAVKDYLFFSHKSSEKGHHKFFEKEGLRPILDLNLRLGEGTGAALAMQIIEDSMKIYTEMATFEEVGIEPGA